MSNLAFENALKYAEEKGFRVFPCEPDGKKPLTRHGFLDATSDPVQIQKWHSSNPKANWAVATGSESGVFVADIDSDETEDWWQSLWIAEGESIDTPRGGRHIYYEYDGSDVDLGITNGTIHKSFDTRGNGGYVLLPGSKTSSKVDPSYGDGEYAGDIAELIPVPAALIELVPEKQSYTTCGDEEIARLDKISKPLELSPQEERAVEGTLGLLDSLRVPWEPGAGWHSTGFYVACSLHRMARSPEYTLTEDKAKKLYLERSPRKPGDPSGIWETRWNSAKKQTEGQVAEPLSDVPIRLDATETLDRFLNSATERLFWESKNVGDVKELIRALRDSGANEQESYSVSYECAAMKEMRRKNPEHSSSTWGYVKSIYEAASADVQETEASAASGKGDNPNRDEWRLLTDAERDTVRDFPNFIDRYVAISREIFAEPNMPLHYVNAWVGLSCAVGDKADIMLKKGRVPMSLWGLLAAPTAGGKGDAKMQMIDFIDSARVGGYSNINAGGDASAEALTTFVAEQEGKVAFFNKDESASLLDAMHDDKSFSKKMMDLALDLYDGKVSKLLRVGNAAEGAGDRKNTVYNMWLQTTFKGMVNSLIEGDAESGFVGRFIVAIGDDAKITTESLTPEFASEYQVSLGGVNPLIKSLGDGVRMFADTGRRFVISADDDVIKRYVAMRKSVLKMAGEHQLKEHLPGIMLRVTENMLKAAGLLAVSEGRSAIAMTDLLLSMKSGQYWVRDAIRILEAITISEYRRKVEAVINFCASTPRTKQQILRSPSFRNEDQRKVSEWIERAEAEGAIARSNSGKYSSVEH